MLCRCQAYENRVDQSSMSERATNIVVLKMDFKDYLITRVNVEERLSLGDKIGTIGGNLGKSFVLTQNSTIENSKTVTYMHFIIDTKTNRLNNFFVLRHRDPNSFDSEKDSNQGENMKC